MKQLPDKLKAISINGLMLSLVAYTVINMQGDALSMPIVPVILAVVAACVDSAGDTFSEVVSSAFVRRIENKQAELNRYMIAV